MRIALVASIVPFVSDEDRTVLDRTASALESGGHHVDIVRLPVRHATPTLVPQLTAYRSLDLTDLADAVICFDSPAHLVQHPRKIVWHLTRSSAVDSTASASLQDSVRHAESAALDEATRVFAGSESISRRLREVDQPDRDVLLAPTGLDQQEWSIVADRLLS